MSEAVWVALVSLGGTLLGSLGGIVASGKLTNFRLVELEKKVEDFGELIEKTHALEQKETVTAERLKSLDHRVSNLENNRKYDIN